MVVLGDKWTCAWAENGHFEVLKWARNNGCSWNKFDLLLCTARNGYFEILKWACKKNNCKM